MHKGERKGSMKFQSEHRENIMEPELIGFESNALSLKDKSLPR